VRQLTDKNTELLSPDGKLIIYSEDDPTTYLNDLWMLDLTTGERRNLTETPDRAESRPLWLSNAADRLVFGSDTEGGMGNNDYPTVVNIDGSGYRVLDAEVGGFRTVSPYGEILYGGYESTARIGSSSSVGQVFDPAQFAIQVEKLFLPAWSPDGRYLAWWVRGEVREVGSSELAILVFDVPGNTAQVIHPYNPAGGSMFANELTWSPDGQWLAFTTLAEPPAGGRVPNLWVVRPDGSDEIYLGIGASLQWRYDSQFLAFYALNEAETEELFLAQAGSWDVTQVGDLPLPERIGGLVDWLVP
jgi:Tol biopolymer transport system component